MYNHTKVKLADWVASYETISLPGHMYQFTTKVAQRFFNVHSQPACSTVLANVAAVKEVAKGGIIR